MILIICKQNVLLTYKCLDLVLPHMYLLFERDTHNKFFPLCIFCLWLKIMHASLVETKSLKSLNKMIRELNQNIIILSWGGSLVPVVDFNDRSAKNIR